MEQIATELPGQRTIGLRRETKLSADVFLVTALILGAIASARAIRLRSAERTDRLERFLNHYAGRCGRGCGTVRFASKEAERPAGAIGVKIILDLAVGNIARQLAETDIGIKPA